MRNKNYNTSVISHHRYYKKKIAIPLLLLIIHIVTTAVKGDRIRGEKEIAISL